MAAVINLTAEERERFARDLEEEAETDRQMAKQMKELNVPEQMYEMLNVRAAAKEVVARELLSWEEQALG